MKIREERTESGFITAVCAGIRGAWLSEEVGGANNQNEVMKVCNKKSSREKIQFL